MSQGEPPPFHDLGDYVFQDLCRDLFEAEESVTICDVYGRRGDSQDGIDLRAYRRDDDGIEVGQCKAYKSFGPAEIKKASDEFFEHWESRWSKSDVKRFILFVACTLDQRKRQDALEEERKRFAAVGIRYEWWSAATIRNQLRPYPEIVLRYFPHPEMWVKEICGQAQTPASPVRTGDKQQGVV